jgi:hypothetical protein
VSAGRGRASSFRPCHGTVLPLLPPALVARADARFYAEGYADGHAHGAQHGVFEGRQLGREKAWEVWDELGFYEGYARVWLRKLAGASGRKEVK